MKVGSNINAYAAQQVQKPTIDRQEYQVRILKQALDSQKDAGDRLLRMLEPKGKNIDIKA